MDASFILISVIILPLWLLSFYLFRKRRLLKAILQAVGELVRYKNDLAQARTKTISHIHQLELVSDRIEGKITKLLRATTTLHDSYLDLTAQNHALNLNNRDLLHTNVTLNAQWNRDYEMLMSDYLQLNDKLRKLGYEPEDTNHSTKLLNQSVKHSSFNLP